MRKSTKKAAVAAFIAVCLTAGITLPVPFGGEIGTVVYADGETTPEASTEYVVSTAEELQAAVVAHKTGTIKLTEDIVLSSCLTIGAADNLTLDLQGHTLSRNLESAVAGGYVVYITGDNSVLTIQNGTITGGKNNNDGGGISSSANINLTLDNVTVTGNSGGDGGGVYFPKGTLTINDCTFSNNKANTKTQAMGGGIFFQGSSITIDGNTVFSGNEALSNGGGICLKPVGAIDGVALGSGVKIQNNTSGGNGGGLWGNSYIALIDLSGTEVTGNTAADNGGGVLANNTIKLSAANINGNQASYGGGIYAANGSTIISTSVIDNNTAANQGGGIYFAGNALSFIGNTTIGKTSTNSNGNTAANGGGLYYSGSGISVQPGGSLYIQGNTATTHGGGIYANSAITIADSMIIRDNTATDNGGGVYGLNTVAISGGTIGGTGAGNTAANGGGVYCGYRAITVSGGDITGNTATGNGGGVYGGDTVTLKGGSITGNTAANGGGVYSDGQLTLSDDKATTPTSTTITGNTATTHGGGIFANSTVQFNTTVPEISSNTRSGSPDNLCIAQEKAIRFELSHGRLFTDKTVGVSIATTSGEGILTNGFWYPGKYEVHPDQYFTSDDPDYMIAVKELGENGEAVLMKKGGTADPVTLTGITKLKFIWKGDKCTLYGFRDNDYEELASGTFASGTATFTIDEKTFTSVKPSGNQSIADASLKTNFETVAGEQYNKLTLSVVSGTDTDDKSVYLTAIGFDIYKVNQDGMVVSNRHNLEKNDFKAYKASYSVAISVESGYGVDVRPYVITNDGVKHYTKYCGIYRPAV